mmetsp:Transcript_26301/g.61155  ORF Transcript_26301/g.61155 Transcript_26301/m.61155 type:complete len:145 (+) Transcript_26301:704-1138(+)
MGGAFHVGGARRECRRGGGPSHCRHGWWIGEILDTMEQTWSTLASMATQRRHFGAAPVENRIVVAGGYDAYWKHLDIAEAMNMDEFLPDDVLPNERCVAWRCVSRIFTCVCNLCRCGPFGRNGADRDATDPDDENRPIAQAPVV